MPATIIDGKAIAAEIQHEIAQQIQARISKGMRPPGPATILVGEGGASRIYVRNKRRACDAVGIASFDYDLAAGTSQTELLNLIDKLNADERVDGTLVQLPLPAHVDETVVIEQIDYTKDVDGFHPYTVGRLSQRIPVLRPCTPQGIMVLLERSGVDVMGHACCHRRRFQSRRPPVGSGDAARRCDHHRLPSLYPEPRRPCSSSRGALRRGGQGQTHPGCVDQARCHGDRHRHQPVDERAVVGRRGLRGGKAARRTDHTGTGRRRSDDGCDAVDQYGMRRRIASGYRTPATLSVTHIGYHSRPGTSKVRP